MFVPLPEKKLSENYETILLMHKDRELEPNLNISFIDYSEAFHDASYNQLWCICRVSSKIWILNDKLVLPAFFSIYTDNIMRG